jgi:hypothetical protein
MEKGVGSSTGFARFVRWATVATLSVMLLGANGVLGAPNAHAASNGLPNNVTLQLSACANNGGLTLPNGSGQFVCSNNSYRTGNVGSGWSELDLVPLRIVASSARNSSTPSYQFTISADYNSRNGVEGIDYLGSLVLNTSLSSHSGCNSVSTGATQYANSTAGYATQAIYRVVSINQTPGSTCVYDYTARLALGSRDFPGGTVHAYLSVNGPVCGGGGGGQPSYQSIGIQQPCGGKGQTTSETMSAVANTSYIWSLAGNGPAGLNLTWNCDQTGQQSATAQETLNWTESSSPSPSGTTVTTHVTASNPADRAVSVSTTDTIYNGSTALDTQSSTVTVPANTTMVVLTHTITVPASTTISNLTARSSSSYSDAVTGATIKGALIATSFTKVQTGTAQNTSATISDVIGLAASGLSYSVDSVSGATGSFSGGYTLGTPTTSSLTWTSTSQSASGSVTFNETIYGANQTNASGALTNNATTNGNGGFTNTQSFSTPVSATAPGYSPAIGDMVVSQNGSNQTQAQNTVQSSISGLSSISFFLLTNGTSSVPAFTAGTTSPVTVTVTKTDQSQTTHYGFDAVSMGGCDNKYDPVFTSPVSSAGKPSSNTLSEGVDGSLTKLVIVNGNPGANTVAVTVNGQQFKFTNLKPGQRVVADVSSAMQIGTNNAVSVLYTGPKGAFAGIAFETP